MIRSLAFQLVVVSSLIATTGHAHDLMPTQVIEQLGLTQAWARPVPVPVGAQSISHQQFFVHQENPDEYVEVVVPVKEAKTPTATTTDPSAPAGGTAPAVAEPASEILMRIATNRVGPSGLPIGMKEAQRLASNEIRRLKRRGIDAVVNVRNVPRVRLYTVGADGGLECRDAETGESIWFVHVGDQRLPYGAIGASEHFLTIINGANLIKVDATNGEVIEEVIMPRAPQFGAINSGDFAVVPMIGGGIEGYPLYDPTRDPFIEYVEGAALAMPTKSPESSRIAWGTDRGFVYVMECEGTPSTLFRLGTDGIVSGRIAAASGDRFYFGSEAGQVYGLKATRSGVVMWSQPFGEPFYNEPMVVGDQVLIRSAYGNLFALNVDTGAMMWNLPVRNISELIAAFDGRAYMTTLSGALAVVDLKSGTLAATFEEVRPAQLLVNKWTDRLYLVSERGEVQCLKAKDSVDPVFNVQPNVEADDDKKAQPKKPDSGGLTPAGGDPFGGAADPFGGGGMADPFGGGGGADPFGAGGGGGADPFGGGGGGGGADPFGGGGGGADPFGGGGGDAPMNDPFGGNPFDG